MLAFAGQIRLRRAIFAQLTAQTPPSWRVRELENAEVSRLRQRTLGTLFPESWHVFNTGYVCSNKTRGQSGAKCELSVASRTSRFRLARVLTADPTPGIVRGVVMTEQDGERCGGGDDDGYFDQGSVPQGRRQEDFGRGHIPGSSDQARTRRERHFHYECEEP